jgi:hypothetical protein
MPYIPNPKGDFLPPVFKTQLQLKVQGAFFSAPAVRKQLGEANARALSKAGLDIRQAVKQSIGSRAPKVTNKWKKSQKKYYQYKGGLYRDATPNAAKPRPAGKPIKSWEPRRWTYYGIRFFYDKGRKTAVVGPDRTAWLYRLHEYGGIQKQTAYAMGIEQAKLALTRKNKKKPIGTTANGMPKTGVILWSARKIRTGGLWKAIGSRTARYPARPFVGSDLVARRLAKCREKFKGTLRGVSYGGSFRKFG